MKVGILTFHRAHNYGALLQCFAMQQVLKSMGHDVSVIDYRQPYIEKMYGIKLRRVLKIIFSLSEIKKYLRSKYKYKSFFRKFNLSKRCDAKHIPESYDAYVIGSDQLWSLDCTNGIDPVYTGFFHHKPFSRIVGYAISVNQKSLKIISNEKLKEILENFHTVSFREMFVVDEVLNRTGKKVCQTIDPTLLTDASLWQPLLNSGFMHKNYVLLYEVRKPLNDEHALRKKAERMAEKNNMEVLDLAQNDFSVSDFVTAFANAECVVTSSFHACAFALIFQKPLCAFLLHDGNDDRYRDLLAIVGASSFLCELNNEIVDFPMCDYKRIQHKLNIIRNESVDYLERALAKYA